MAASEQKAFCVPQFTKAESLLLCNERSDGHLKPTVTGSAYHDALHLWLFPQYKESEPDNFIWHQDDAPSHWHLSVRDWLKITVLDQWIFYKVPDDKVPPLPADLPDLRHRIEASVARITSDTLNKVWDELAYRIGVCLVMNEAHIEHLYKSTQTLILHWCAKIKDEVEKLAYQLKEEAERTERPIRRLSKVMYGSTCADMQVDVMGECLSSIKHVVGTTSGCFYPRSNHWEVGGRPQCDKCGCRVRNCSQHRFMTLETISNYRNSYPGFSSGRPRGTTPADDRYIVLQARRNRRQTAGEIARHTTQATGRPISRFTVARRLHSGGLFARRPVRCVPLTPAHRRRHESRFSLSRDSHRILIWRERGSRNHPSNIIERDRYGGHGVLVWGGIMLGSRTDLHIFDAGSVNGTRYCNEILLPYVRLFRGAMGLQFLFKDDNAPCHRTVAAEQLLESEDIERMDWPARSPDLNPIEHVWDFLGRRLAARTLPPVTIRELRLALQDEWAAMPQQLIDTLILSMGRRCETCLAVRGHHIPY
ncbi:transposable element Tcb2 transposase [Trichonephila clavipes]|uniref:Transposable element Tcb2 transposase n=1 Tax=Trichonephila clavipes TaxID=2585209 RepID=A0A8X6VK06_TRICX|nr:transposable element Tcb2 transposase [Trichonephila clavipes]